MLSAKRQLNGVWLRQAFLSGLALESHKSSNEMCISVLDPVSTTG